MEVSGLVHMHNLTILPSKETHCKGRRGGLNAFIGENIPWPCRVSNPVASRYTDSTECDRCLWIYD
jgi:hypothetical protein